MFYSSEPFLCHIDHQPDHAVPFFHSHAGHSRVQGDEHAIIEADYP